MFKCDIFFSLAFGSSTEVWVHHGVGPRPRWGAVGIAWKGRLPEAAADTNPPRHVLLLILSPSLSGGGKVMKVTARSWCWSCFLMERHSLVLSPGTAGVLSQTSLVPPPDHPLPCWEETDSQLALAVLTLSLLWPKPLLPLLLRNLEFALAASTAGIRFLVPLVEMFWEPVQQCLCLSFTTDRSLRIKAICWQGCTKQMGVCDWRETF